MAREEFLKGCLTYYHLVAVVVMIDHVARSCMASPSASVRIPPVVDTYASFATAALVEGSSPSCLTARSGRWGARRARVSAKVCWVMHGFRVCTGSLLTIHVAMSVTAVVAASA